MAQESSCAPGGFPICVCNGPASPEKEEAQVVGTTKVLQQSAPSSALERAAYTIPEFCFRNHISRPAYHRLRAQGRNPAEMRIGLNMIRITAEAEDDWQQLMQEPNAELEQQAVARAVKAGEAAAKSDKHVSKTGAQGHSAGRQAPACPRQTPRRHGGTEAHLETSSGVPSKSAPETALFTRALEARETCPP